MGDARHGKSHRQGGGFLYIKRQVNDDEDERLSAYRGARTHLVAAGGRGVVRLLIGVEHEFVELTWGGYGLSKA